MYVWSATTSWPLNNPLSNGLCNALTQLPNGQLAASSASNINIWSPLNNPPILVRTLAGHTGWVQSLALSPDCSTLASGSADNKIKLWRYATQTTVLKTLTGHTDQVRAVCFVSDQILASGSVDLTIKIWNTQTGKSKILFF